VDFILNQNNLYIVVIALTSGAMLLWPTLMKGRGTTTVDVNQAVQLANQKQAIFLDVRPADQFKTGSIPQARNLPASELEAKLHTLPKNKPVIVVCNQGRESAKAVAALHKHGLTEAVSLEGGLASWSKEGLPLSRKN
jgi:rhodanese-related sulfurtransferase